MKTFLPFVLCASLAACAADETITAYGAGDNVWHVIEINGAAFDATATISFAAAETVTGTAPCNTFTARQMATYPWIKLGATKRACPDLAQEATFFETLSAVNTADVLGGTMILRAVTEGETTAQMVLEAC
ncbi:META domain-containing protein [Nereida sp.]|uniref:META domain-containing protein n=1 Tax=Nereida sp. TaxID=2736090 RepID=UPI003F695BEA